MIRSLLLVLVLIPSLASALELKLGSMETFDPLYESVYDDELDDNGMVGKIEVSHAFKLTEVTSIAVFAAYLNLFHDHDPHYGIGGIGVELRFKLPL